MTMFETSILCNKLPRSINSLDKLISSNESLSALLSNENSSDSQKESLKQYRKLIRDCKRDMLMEMLKNYETNFEENEYLYQEELFRFEYEFSTHVNEIKDLVSSLHNYLNHRTDRITRDIRYKEAILRMKLKYPRHRRKLSSSDVDTSINIYPEAIVETLENIFTREELNFLSSTGNTRLL